jgi:glucose/arabinose dehydrogenase
VDADGDHVADKTYTYTEGLRNPNGLLFHNGALYVGEFNRILRYDGIENALESPPAPAVVTDALPAEEAHGSKYFALGPDNRLYFGIGAPCDHCDPTTDYNDPRLGTITSMNLDGSDIQPYVMGVRNSVGLAWHPENGTLYFTDNGRDNLGDDAPDCELDRVTAPGQHFGNPYIHGGDVPDPEHGAGKNPDDYVKPIQKLGPHVTPLGMHFYTGSMFPAEYKNRIFIALKGSTNRSLKSGYCVKQVTLDKDGNVAKYEDFATGWVYREEAFGRPVDVCVAKDGALFVSDEQAGVIYRIAYGK